MTFSTSMVAIWDSLLLSHGGMAPTPAAWPADPAFATAWSVCLFTNSLTAFTKIWLQAVRSAIYSLLD